MFSKANLLLALVTSSLYGQSVGFWPFSVFAESDGSNLSDPDLDTGVKQIAIIGMQFF